MCHVFEATRQRVYVDSILTPLRLGSRYIPFSVRTKLGRCPPASNIRTQKKCSDLSWIIVRQVNMINRCDLSNLFFCSLPYFAMCLTLVRVTDVRSRWRKGWPPHCLLVTGQCWTPSAGLNPPSTCRVQSSSLALVPTRWTIPQPVCPPAETPETVLTEWTCHTLTGHISDATDFPVRITRPK